MDSPSNVTFKESEFVNNSVSNDEVRDARVSFVQFMLTWVSSFSGEFIETLEICLSKPVGFEAEIEKVVEFAVSKGVKNLILDFSDLSWVTINEAKGEASVFQLPDCVYQSTTLESLKLFFCVFNPSKFPNRIPLKTLCFGFIELRNIKALLSKCPLLDSLTMSNCWNVGLDEITDSNNRLRELVYKNCEFLTQYSTLDLPSIKIFKYSGTFHYFEFERVNRTMHEAELDFEAESEYDEDTGNLLYRLLYDLLSARKVTVCPYLLQVIQECDDPITLEQPMQTKHLVMKTSMQFSEYVGIRLLIGSSHDLETLTFVMVPPRNVVPTPTGQSLETYWLVPIVHECMEKTLKNVEVKNFRGSGHEVLVLQNLIQHCRVLEKMEFYVAEGLERNGKLLVRDSSNLLGRKCPRGSSRLRISTHAP